MRRARRAKLAPIANSALDTHPPLPICICVLVHIWICAHIYKYMLAHTLNEYTEWLHRIVYRCTTATTPSTTVFEFATAYISFSTSHATHSLVCVRIHVLVHVLDISRTKVQVLYCIACVRACVEGRGPSHAYGTEYMHAACQRRASLTEYGALSSVRACGQADAKRRIRSLGGYREPPLPPTPSPTVRRAARRDEG